MSYIGHGCTINLKEEIITKSEIVADEGKLADLSSEVRQNVLRDALPSSLTIFMGDDGI